MSVTPSLLSSRLTVEGIFLAQNYGGLLKEKYGWSVTPASGSIGGSTDFVSYIFISLYVPFFDQVESVGQCFLW